MIYIFISLVVYVIFVVIHVFLHRLLARWKILTFKTTLIFGLGGLLDVYLVLNISRLLEIPQFRANWWNITLPLSAVSFYILLVGIHTIFYTAPAFSYVSPSTQLLSLLEKQGRMTYQTIQRYFSNQQMVVERLHDLKDAHLIEMENSTCRITPGGIRIIKIMGYYKKMLGWHWRG